MTNQIVLPGADKQRMIEQVRAAGLDGMLLSSAENVHYASGLPTLPDNGNPLLFALRPPRLTSRRSRVSLSRGRKSHRVITSRLLDLSEMGKLNICLDCVRSIPCAFLKGVARWLIFTPILKDGRA